MHVQNRRTALRARSILGLVAGAGLLAACGGGDPLAQDTADSGTAGSADAGQDGAVVVGSQDYYSNEIIAELYAQALEARDVPVERELRIGQREVYMPELESGALDLFPEYSGPVLQYWVEDPPQRSSDEVYAALVEAAPEGLQVLDQAEATDQDAYVVTSEFAQEWDLETIDDLAQVEVPMTMGANSEAELRPNGPQGLAEVYGVEVDFTPIEDGGGPLTVSALEDGSIQLAIMYTADPSIAQNDLVVLEDTQGLFLASHVVPLASGDLPPEAVDVVDEVNANLTTEELRDLNARSTQEELPAADIARDWLSEQGLN